MTAQPNDSETNFRHLFEDSPLAMWVTETDSLRFLDVNRAAIAQYGYSREEFLAMTLLEVLPPERREPVRAVLAQHREVIRRRGVHQRKNGDRIDVEITGYPTVFEGRAARVSMAHDVTEHTRTEEALRLITETIHEVFWMSDPTFTRMLYLSAAFERVFGRPRQWLMDDARAYIEAVHPEDREATLVAQGLLERGEPFEARFRICRPDGSVRWLRGSGFPVRAPGGPIEAVVGVLQDITERHLAEQQQLMLEERFTAVFHASPNGKAIVDEDGRVAEANQQLGQLLGCERAELPGRSILDPALWADPKQRGRVEQALAAEAVWTDELQVRRPKGGLRNVLLSLQPLRIGLHRVFVATFVDTTERKAMEAQLQRFLRTESVGRLASGIAHDMNNILAPIIMGVPLLRTGQAAADAEKILDAIETSAHRGAALVRQLLIFGRGIEGERRLLQPAAVVTEVVTMCRQTFPKNVVLAPTVARELRCVLADPTQLQQVLLNLAVNARDAMPHGGRVEITLENADIDDAYATLHKDARPGRYVLLRVHDTGTGIMPDVAEHMFDPFYTTKPEGRGTGLGLSTVLGIVKGHGGFIRLHTEVGRGSTFDVYLPAGEPAAAERPAAEPRAALRGNGELILVVDDEESVRGVLREILLKFNYRVISAEDGVEATATFAANPDVKVVLTDLDMPVMDGVKLARVLRHMRPAVPVVVSTGLGRRSEAKRRGADLDTAGIRHVLMKPYTGDTLLRVVHAAVHGDPAVEGG